MRRNLYSLLLGALCSLLGTNVWAQDLNTTFIDGTEYYEIGTADDLATLANIVNGGETDANAVLTTDIDMASLIEMDGWTPIGDWNTGAVSSAYCGHFNGQGHKITGFNATATQNYYGIFGVISTGALIENFTIYGTVSCGYKTMGVVGYARDATPTIRGIHSYLNINNTAAGNRHGGILGSSVNGTIIVDRCTYSGTLDGNDNANNGNYGGIVGYVNNNASAHLKVTNCLFDGKLINSAATPGGCTFGGMVGYVGASPDVTVTNCLSIGTLQSKITGQFYGAVKNAACSIVNSFYQGDIINGSASTVTPTTQEVTNVTTKQLDSGEICFLLNERVSGGENWFQTLVVDAHPFPYNGGVHDIIYLAGRTHCDGSAYEGVTGYTNEPATQDDHNFQDGFCTVCNALDETWLTANGEGFFEIANEKQLVWFATYVNEVNAAPNAVLTADINLTKAWTTPIGNASVAYTGKFDGQGKSITGFDQTATTTHNGLFGNINGATVQNFCISGSLTSDKNYCGVIGLSKGSSKVKGIHSSLNLDIQFKGWAGGIVGGADGFIVIEECTFDGTLDTHNFDDSKGGILGYANGATIKNCIFCGTIKGEAKQHYGGILGYVNNGSFGGVQNCLSVGSVTTTNESHNGVAAIIGNMNSSTKVDGVFNNYWLTGSSYAGNNGAKAQDAEAPIEVTAAQLASGEVAARLGIAFRQNIGTDIYPVLDPTHNVVAEITDAGYATLYVPDADIAVPAGVTAYTAQIAVNENNGKQHLALAEVEGGVIPAQTAVILKGTADIYEFAVSAGETVPDGAFKIHEDVVDGSNALVKAWAAPIAGNVLKGAAEDIEAAGKYVLAKVDGKVCFYLATSGTIKAGKAYLDIASDVKAFYFGFDEATGIEMVNGQWSTANGQSIYNLAGQRLQKMQRGINITAGKKILK